MYLYTYIYICMHMYAYRYSIAVLIVAYHIPLYVTIGVEKTCLLMENSYQKKDLGTYQVILALRIFTA